MREHARWLTVDDVTEGVLKQSVHPDACVVDQPGWRNEDRTRAVLQAKAGFVAVLSSYPPGRFNRLIERATLVEHLAVAGVDRDT
jgi:hypothetical protein